MKNIIITGITLCFILSLGACAAIFGLQSNQADDIVTHLAIGLTKKEVELRLHEMPYVTLSKETFLLPRDYSYFGVNTEAVPFDLLSTTQEGTEIWHYSYPVPPDYRLAVSVFFSGNGRVIGWVRGLSEASKQKYLHEKLTSNLKIGMTDAQVVTMLGQPQTFVPKLAWKERTRELYSDHYWRLADPTDGRPHMWMYSYKMPDGAERHVYLLWEKTLSGWGYDNAHIEAERYLHEHTQ